MKQFKVYLVLAIAAAMGAVAIEAATAQSRIDRIKKAEKAPDCTDNFKKKYLKQASSAYNCRSEFKPICRNGTVLGSVDLEKDGNSYRITYTCESPAE